MFTTFIFIQLSESSQTTTSGWRNIWNKARTTLSGDKKVYIKECHFGPINSASNGGCIAFTSTSEDSRLLVEFCIFEDCHSNSNGGSICMTYSGTEGGSCVINKCCASKCSALSGGLGHFVYTYLYNDGDHLNQVQDSSVINCNADKGTGQGTLNLQRGIIMIKTVNLSQNSCSQYCPLYCAPFSISSFTACSVSFCSIRGNTANTAYGLDFYNGAKHELSNSNLIENDIKGSNGLIYCYGQLTIDECTILENSATPMFYCYSGSVTITNCTIKEEDVKGTKIAGSVTTGSAWKASSSFINAIHCTQDHIYL